MNDEGFYPFDDVSSADPKIQTDYEAALGKFLVTFNKVDNLLSRIIELSLFKAGRTKIEPSISNARFDRKIETLDLISLHFPKISDQSLIIDLKNLNGERNHLAHGHFDQNPFDGSYEVISKNKPSKQPISKIISITEAAEEIFDKLRYSEAWLEFDDLSKKDK